MMRLIINTHTYRTIAFGCLTLFLSILVMPVIIVTTLDENTDISLVYSFVEEESEIKGELNMDDFVQLNSFIPDNNEIRTVSTPFFFDNILMSFFSLGIIVPPPKFC
jgi:hypothetical protein